MKLLLVVLILMTFGGGTLADKDENNKYCRSDKEGKLYGFSGASTALKITMPCKYLAVKRQQCGDYTITVAPTQGWYKDTYRLESVWLGISSKAGEFSVRTENKIALKFINDNSGTRSLFQTPKGETINVDKFKNLFEQDTTGEKGKKNAGYLQAKNGDFRLTFFPWHPANPKVFPSSKFELRCRLSEGQTLNNFPQQICGNESKRAVEEYAKNTFALPKKFRALSIFQEVFSNNNTEQTKSTCQEAEKIFRETCKERSKMMDALKTCQEILTSKEHTKCVTRYSCDPMDVFNACMKWACTGSGFGNEEGEEKDLCYSVGEAIDMCPIFHSTFLDVNLTKRVDDARCYTKFFIPPPKSK